MAEKIFTYEVESVHGKTYIDIKKSSFGKYVQITQIKNGKRATLTFQENLDDVISALQQARIWM